MNNITNISNAAGTYERQATIGETTDRKALARENGSLEKKPESTADRVSLSTESKDMQTARQALLTVPEEKSSNADRAEKIAGLQQAVAEGNYEVDPEQVAEKLIGSIIDMLA